LKYDKRGHFLNQIPKTTKYSPKYKKNYDTISTLLILGANIEPSFRENINFQGLGWS
jgi:hypothetical protein